MTTIKSIDQFLSQKNIAILGVSKNKDKFGNIIYYELIKKNYNVFPLHKTINDFNNQKCYNKISELPNKVTAIIFCAKITNISEIANEINKSNIDNIWIQNGTIAKDDIKKLELLKQSNIIKKQCLMMFLEPVKGIHGFHRFISKIFGMYPK